MTEQNNQLYYEIKQLEETKNTRLYCMSDKCQYYPAGVLFRDSIEGKELAGITNSICLKDDILEIKMYNEIKYYACPYLIKIYSEIKEKKKRL